MENFDYEKAVKNIRSELKDYVVNNNRKSLVLGISGGIDSALVAALASPVCIELNIPLIGRSIPIHTNKLDEMERAMQVGKHFCTDFKETDLTPEFMELKEIDTYDKITDVATNLYKVRMGNMKARLRMIYLYNLAAKNNGMVLSTDNWSEYLLGFWTLKGDEGDYGMIQELWKTEVYDMSEWMCFNELKNDSQKRDALLNCINCMATDGLGVTDRGDLGQIMPEFEGNSRDGYKLVDNILERYTSKPNVFLNDHSVIKRHISSDFKRNNPTNIPRKLIIK